METAITKFKKQPNFKFNKSTDAGANFSKVTSETSKVNDTLNHKQQFKLQI